MNKIQVLVRSKKNLPFNKVFLFVYESMNINSPSDDGQGNSYRQVYKIRIDYSSNCDFFNYGTEANIYSNTVINFTNPIIASNVKITIVEVDPQFADSAQIALNKYN